LATSPAETPRLRCRLLPEHANNDKPPATPHNTTSKQPPEGQT
jgi:hypothetical protein